MYSSGAFLDPSKPVKSIPPAFSENVRTSPVPNLEIAGFLFSVFPIRVVMDRLGVDGGFRDCPLPRPRFFLDTEMR